MSTIFLFLNFRNYLKQLFPQSWGYSLTGELFIKIPFNKLFNFLFFLKKHSQSQFKSLSDICGLDFPWKKNRFEIFYNLLSLTFNSRIMINICFNEKSSILSIENIFKIATWFERELWDLFGIYFTNNKDLRRILTDYGFKGHPLRKDFPLSGYVEVRYFFNEKRIIVETLNLTQEYRLYFFNNSWNI